MNLYQIGPDWVRGRRLGDLVEIYIALPAMTGLSGNGVYLASSAAIIPAGWRPPGLRYGGGAATQPGVDFHPVTYQIDTAGLVRLFKNANATAGFYGSVMYRL
mgnify:CR=1 FL=1